MQKLDPKTDGSTANIVEQNVAKLRELFPDVFAEGKVDFDALREVLGSYIDDRQERYSFTWNGKGLAKRIAQTPSTGALRPCPEESVGWETTQNLFIEGDNLEVLKLLQKSYHRRVKMIYIDPPYNTGADFIYPDNFRDNIANYLQVTQQTDEEGRKLSANAETSGRYHTDWLNMMYPRLKLGRNLLCEDGIFLVSIDEHESANLRKLCDEVLGEENFVAQLVWEKTRKNDAKLFSVGHEYMFVYARDLQRLKDTGTIWREQKPGTADIVAKWEELKAKYSEDYEAMEKALQEWYRALPDEHPSKKLSRYRHIDQYGPWRDRDISWPGGGGPTYDVIHPTTGQPCAIPEAGWRFSTLESMQNQIDLGLVMFREDHTKPPFRKAHLVPLPAETDDNGENSSESDDESSSAGMQVMPSVIYKQAQVATKYLRGLLGSKLFDNPKDHEVLARLIRYVADRKAIVVDFFCGSGSTAEAVLRLNQEDGGSRRFIMVQLPEQLDSQKKEQKVAYKFCQSLGVSENVAEIGKERIRRVIKQIDIEQTQKTKEAKEKLPGTSEAVAVLDLGFKVFKLDASNIKPWDANFDNVKEALLNAVENIKPDRTESDVLYELLLKYGLDLAVPIEERRIDGKTVYIIGAGALIVCLADKVSLDVVEGIAKLKAELKPEVMRVVFKDAGFKDDVVKTNAVQILRQAGIEDVKSL
jgi:adenine-specific DNA-methyltransferase